MDTDLHLTAWTSSSPARSWKHIKTNMSYVSLCMCGVSAWAWYLNLHPFAWLIFVWPDVNENVLFPADAHSPFSLYVFCVEGKDLEMNHTEHKKSLIYDFKKSQWQYLIHNDKFNVLLQIHPGKPVECLDVERRCRPQIDSVSELAPISRDKNRFCHFCL